jgi:hypothetical protein
MEGNHGRAWCARVSAAWVHFREAFGSTTRCLSARSLVIWRQISTEMKADGNDPSIPQSTTLSHVTTEGRGGFYGVGIDRAGILARILRRQSRMVQSCFEVFFLAFEIMDVVSGILLLGHGINNDTC